MPSGVIKTTNIKYSGVGKGTQHVAGWTIFRLDLPVIKISPMGWRTSPKINLRIFVLWTCREGNPRLSMHCIYISLFVCLSSYYLRSGTLNDLQRWKRGKVNVAKRVSFAGHPVQETEILAELNWNLLGRLKIRKYLRLLDFPAVPRRVLPLSRRRNDPKLLKNEKVNE